MKHILIAYEESPVSDHVLERTAELAKAFGARVTVTSVAPVLVGAGHGIGPYDPPDPPERHAREVHDAISRLGELGVHGATAAPLVGDAVDVIVELAKDRQCDLIAIGAHEGGLVSRLAHGSIGDSIVHRSAVDVLVVR